jgi:hypothetical protein
MRECGWQWQDAKADEKVKAAGWPAYWSACSAGGRAAALNALFDEWLKGKNGEPPESIARFGTVDWLFREFKTSKRYRVRVSARAGHGRGKAKRSLPCAAPLGASCTACTRTLSTATYRTHGMA